MLVEVIESHRRDIVVNELGVIPDQLIAMLLRDQGNDLIGQFRQVSDSLVMDDGSRSYFVQTYLMKVVRLRRTDEIALSSQVVSSGQKMM